MVPVGVSKVVLLLFECNLDVCEIIIQVLRILKYN